MSNALFTRGHNGEETGTGRQAISIHYGLPLCIHLELTLTGGDIAASQSRRALREALRHEQLLQDKNFIETKKKEKRITTEQEFRLQEESN